MKIVEQSLQPESAIVTVCATFRELKKPGMRGTNHAKPFEPEFQKYSKTDFQILIL